MKRTLRLPVLADRHDAFLQYDHPLTDDEFDGLLDLLLVMKDGMVSDEWRAWEGLCSFLDSLKP